jgi:hypothetical protein
MVYEQITHVIHLQRFYWSTWNEVSQPPLVTLYAVMPTAGPCCPFLAVLLDRGQHPEVMVGESS